jgi:hypothetical protein
MSGQLDYVWGVQQARDIVIHFAERPKKPALLLCDQENKFVDQLTSC